MVTVKDLKTFLDNYAEDMPVYWGVDVLPCWIAKKNATIKSFPVKVETDRENVEYLYFGDYNDYSQLYKEFYNYRYDKEHAGWWKRIKFLFGF